jgi:multiple sugar transport system ATP-binding protein
MASVTYNHVWKKFGDVEVLKDIQLSINDKEFLVLVGPSGCGKSTALRCLAGLEEVTDGEILIGDRVVNDVSPKDRDIAMVFQSYALYPHMTVFDNMAFGLKLRKTPKEEIQKRVTEAAATLGLDRLLQRRPRELSGGQRQRVALGRAIVRNPQVFLFDEPLSNLDAKLRVQPRSEISKLHQRLQTTFIYVTHDQVEAMTMADRIAVMYKGIIQQLDTPQMLYDFPCNLFVAGFIGSPSMNFFNGKIRKGDGKVYFEHEAFSVEIPENRKEVYAGMDGKDVVFGIRPENIHNPEFCPPGIVKADVAAKVDVTELMGNEIFVYCIAGSTQFSARVDPRSRYSIGSTVNLVFDMSNFHIFDPSVDSENPVAIR